MGNSSEKVNGRPMYTPPPKFINIIHPNQARIEQYIFNDGDTCWIRTSGSLKIDNAIYETIDESISQDITTILRQLHTSKRELKFGISPQTIGVDSYMTCPRRLRLTIRATNY